MKTLHIIRNLNDKQSLATIRSLPNDDGKAILLTQDAVFEEIQFDTENVFICKEDSFAREIETRYQQISYDEIVRLVIEYDRTIVW